MALVIGTLASIVVTAIAIWFFLKKYQPQMVLFGAGLVLMLVGILLGAGPATILPAKVKTTGFIGFDMLKFIERIMSARVAGLGLIIMSAGGFATYLDKIGASEVMVRALIKPLRALKAPYVLLALTFLIGSFLKVFIASAAGLSLLLLVTTFPLLLALGVSRVAAAAMVVTCGCFDLGPASGNSNLAAANAGIPVALYFVKYQLPVAIVGLLTMSISLYFVQSYFDKKDGVGIAGGVMPEAIAEEGTQSAKEKAPGYYGFLPIIPVTLLLVFNDDIGIKGFKLDIVTVMLFSFLLAIICECIRHKDRKAVMKNAMAFFESMGKMFATVISMIVAGETFAQGLVATGSIDVLISGAQGAGFGPITMTVVMTGFMSVACIVMGGGSASFFSFAALAPKIATAMAFQPVVMMLPMQFAAGLARALTPISPVVVAVAGVVNLSPFELVRRTAIPVAISLLTSTIACLIVPTFYQ